MLNDGFFPTKLLLSNKYSLDVIDSIVIPRTFVEPHHIVENVGKLFLANSNLQSLPVVHHEIPVGIVHRYQLMDIFLSAYGRDLHGKKPISKFMDTNPIIIEHNITVEIASQYVTQNMNLPVAQDFIVTKNGRYTGMGTVLELLKKVTELQIQEYNHTLVQQVHQLEHKTAELTMATMKAQTATEQAEAANRAKSRFLANMSHELRTPLNAIIGYSEMLQDDACDIQYPKCQDCAHDLNKIVNSAKHLLSLVGNILDISKIEAGKINLYLEHFDFATVLQEVAHAIQPLIQENKNTLLVEYGHLGTVRADRVKVKQCLFNLLSNAAKFSQNSTILLFAARETTKDSDNIIFGVRDKGIGMSAEQMNKAFDPFSQVDDSSTRKYGGTGLGLAITKQFCEMMGGVISVESKINGGSTFIIRQPAYVNDINQ